MYENVTLQNRQQVDQACVVLEENSVFNMHGGVIQNCKGKYGGVSLKNGSRFIMEGGTISGCEANDGRRFVCNKSINHHHQQAAPSADVYGSTCVMAAVCVQKIFQPSNHRAAAQSADVLRQRQVWAAVYMHIIQPLPSAAAQSKTTKQHYGGGVALIGNSTIEDPITNWTVIGNEAYKTNRGNGGIGGGIYLENGSMDVSDWIKPDLQQYGRQTRRRYLSANNRCFNHTAQRREHGRDLSRQRHKH